MSTIKTNNKFGDHHQCRDAVLPGKELADRYTRCSHQPTSDHVTSERTLTRTLELKQRLCAGAQRLDFYSSFGVRVIVPCV